MSIVQIPIHLKKMKKPFFYTLPRSGQTKSNPSSQKQNLNYYNMTKPKPVITATEEHQRSCVSKNNFQPYPVFVTDTTYTMDRKDNSNNCSSGKPKSKKTSRKLAYDDSFLSFRPTCYLTHSKSNGEKKIRSSKTDRNDYNNFGDSDRFNESRHLRRNLSRSVNDLDQLENSDLKPSPYRLELQKDQVLYENPKTTKQKQKNPNFEKQKVKISKSHNPEASKIKAEKILVSNSKSMKIEKGRIDQDSRLFGVDRADKNKKAANSVFIEDYFIHADPVC